MYAAAPEPMDQLIVAIDTGPLHGPLTGVGVAVQHLIDALVASSDDALAVVPYLTSFRAELGGRTTGGVSTRRLPLPAALAHRLWSRFDVPRADRWLRPANIIHGTNYVVPPSRMPRVVSVYDCWFLRHLSEVHPDVRRSARGLKRAVSAGAVVHASSHATADEVRDLLETDRVRVVHLGAPPPVSVTDELAPVPELEGVPYVLALGTLEKRKNLPRLVEAFDSVAAANPDALLVLAGSGGDDGAAIRDAIDGLRRRHASRVLLTGRVDAASKAWLLHHAAVLAYPSLDEGFGFPLLEAMAAGAPVVASTAGSIPEVAGDAALLVAPDDTDALAGALSAVLQGGATRARLLEAAPRQLARFTWNETAAGLRALYRELISERSAT